MMMLTRDAMLGGAPTERMAWATDVAAGFEQATGREVGVWVSIAGGVTGHVTWSLPVAGLAEIGELTRRALEDEDYLAQIEAGGQFMAGPPHDTLYRAYGGAPFEPGNNQPGNVAIVTTAASKSGSLGHAVGWGLEAAEYVSRLTGVPTVLLGNAAGRFSRLTWMGVAEDAEAADAAEQALRDDDGYLKLIARGGGFFADDTARTQFFARVA